jgi:hypothetical protein
VIDTGEFRKSAATLYIVKRQAREDAERQAREDPEKAFHLGEQLRKQGDVSGVRAAY